MRPSAETFRRFLGLAAEMLVRAIAKGSANVLTTINSNSIKFHSAV